MVEVSTLFGKCHDGVFQTLASSYVVVAILFLGRRSRKSCCKVFFLTVTNLYQKILGAVALNREVPMFQLWQHFQIGIISFMIDKHSNEIYHAISSTLLNIASTLISFDKFSVKMDKTNDHLSSVFVTCRKTVEIWCQDLGLLERLGQ